MNDSPFHKVDHVDAARCANHGLVGQDGPHGLLDTELWLQGREEGLHLFPVGKKWRELCEKGEKKTVLYCVLYTKYTPTKTINTHSKTFKQLN